MPKSVIAVEGRGRFVWWISAPVKCVSLVTADEVAHYD